jgi:VanZ family protein
MRLRRAEMKFLRYWGPVLVVAILISVASTSRFGSSHTSRIILPILRWLMPHARLRTLESIHHMIRKCAHVVEYFAFGLLVLRALRSGRTGWCWTWAYSTMLVVAGFSLMDEFHQIFVPGRGASVFDSLLDTCAGALAVLIFWIITLRRMESGRSGQGAA